MYQLKIIPLFFLFITNIVFSQELLADVIVDYSSVQGSNTQVYKTLEKELKKFINTTKWTDKKYDINERIQCAFYINITERPTNNTFKGTLTIQSRRPVYNSSYFTPTLNYIDKKINFEYTEFETLLFNERKFSGKNLTDIIGFYVYFILGIDADTFANLGGTNYFIKCQKIAQNSENNGFDGWSTFDGLQAKATFINDMLKPIANNLREISYQYHLNGLDMMQIDELNAKNSIITTLIRLEDYQNNPQFFPLDMFLTAKKQEIASLFSGGSPTTNIQKLKEILSLIDPSDKAELWDKMKN